VRLGVRCVDDDADYPPAIVPTSFDTAACNRICWSASLDACRRPLSHSVAIRSSRLPTLCRSRRASDSNAALSSGATRQLYTSDFFMHYMVVHAHLRRQPERRVEVEMCRDIHLPVWSRPSRVTAMGMRVLVRILSRS